MNSENHQRSVMTMVIREKACSFCNKDTNVSAPKNSNFLYNGNMVI